MRLTKTYDDGSFGVADDLPCGENSHDFKHLLIQTLGWYETKGKRLIDIGSAYEYLCAIPWVCVTPKGEERLMELYQKHKELEPVQPKNEKEVL